MANSNNNKINVKLLIDTKNRRVLFAEAGKDFVDFLITLLALPIGTVIRLLTRKSMVGTISNLYHSVETLSDTYIQPNVNKETLLNPKIAGATSSFLSLPPPPTTTPTTTPTPSGPTKMYRCGSSYCNTVSSDQGIICRNCGNRMSTLMTILAAAPSSGGVGPTEAAAVVGEGGYVKGVATYMVMDDLAVKPMSTISSIAMLNQFNVKEVGALQERVVSLGMNEGLKLLEASLRSNTVLTDVLLQMKKSTKKR